MFNVLPEHRLLKQASQKSEDEEESTQMADKK